jgi:Flp pilus assembly protein TadG
MIIRAIRRFLDDRRGNILPMFGLSLIPIMGLIGAAVDYSRANAVKSKMQAALDSTALAMAASASTQSASQLTASATAYFNAMFSATSTSGVTLSVSYTNNSGEGPRVTVTGSTSVKTQFMNIPGFGISELPVSAMSQAAWGNTRLRVSLVLDNTGSMADDGKIGALKTATKNLLNQLKASAQNDGDVYVSIIPFSQDVNIGKAYYNQNYIDWTDWDSANKTCSGWQIGNSCVGTWVAANHNTWNGCVADRGNSSAPASQNYDQNVTAPGSSAASKFPADSQGGCPPQSIMGLNYNWTTMSSMVDNMQPNGGTNQPIGLVWGWQSLVGGGPLTAPVMDPNYSYTQVIILLTDGLNTIDRWYGNGSQQSPQVDSRMYKSSDGSGTCANIKAAGIELYTIQVNTGGDPTSTMLQKCATDSSHFFLLTDSSQIVTLFNQIGTKLSRLRVSK